MFYYNLASYGSTNSVKKIKASDFSEAFLMPPQASINHSYGLI